MCGYDISSKILSDFCFSCKMIYIVGGLVAVCVCLHNTVNSEGKKWREIKVEYIRTFFTDINKK